MRSPLPYKPAHKAPCLLHGQAQIGPGFPLVIEGIQLHGAQEQAIDPGPLAQGRYAHFIERAFHGDDADWAVFSLSRLARTPEFRQAAA